MGLILIIIRRGRGGPRLKPSIHLGELEAPIAAEAMRWQTLAANPAMDRFLGALQVRCHFGKRSPGFGHKVFSGWLPTMVQRKEDQDGSA